MDEKPAIPVNFPLEKYHKPFLPLPFGRPIIITKDMPPNPFAPIMEGWVKLGKEIAEAMKKLLRPTPGRSYAETRFRYHRRAARQARGNHGKVKFHRDKARYWEKKAYTINTAKL